MFKGNLMLVVALHIQDMEPAVFRIGIGIYD